VIKVSW